jgi:hypothetical protein
VIRLLPLVLVLAACNQPQAGVYRAPSGKVSGSLASGVGPVTVGVNSGGGGYVGTHIGWLGLGAGF